MFDFALVFGSAFIAATLLPFYSEVVLVAKAGQTPELWVAFWLAASIGNTLGSWVNWLLGRYLLHFQDRRWFPFRGKQLATGQRWFNRFGVWSLLLAWLPVGGDALTFIAGIMKVPVGRFVVLVFVGKAARYLFVLAVADRVIAYI